MGQNSGQDMYKKRYMGGNTLPILLPNTLPGLCKCQAGRLKVNCLSKNPCQFSPMIKIISKLTNIVPVKTTPPEKQKMKILEICKLARNIEEVAEETVRAVPGLITIIQGIPNLHKTGK